MDRAAYCLFETTLGSCGIAWTQDAERVVLFQLPESTAKRTEARIAASAVADRASSPPAAMAAVIERIVMHLEGHADDFRDVELNLDESPKFARQVYAAARDVLPGQTTTYGKLAESIGRPHAARAVGQALGRNPIALIIPCHRVLAAGSKPGGFSAHGGLATKARMLAIEGGIEIESYVFQH
jgi:O-6-methylguanine DNA methyltransferase